MDGRILTVMALVAFVLPLLVVAVDDPEISPPIIDAKGKIIGAITAASTWTISGRTSAGAPQPGRIGS
jgi:hypothetical protein